MSATEPPGKDERRRIAHERLAARARRIATLRRRVVAGALATFVLAWGVVSQTGSLGQTTTTSAAATASTPPTTVVSAVDNTTGAAAAAAASDTTSTSAAAPVTTSQS
jgi:hypothetical protein